MGDWAVIAYVGVVLVCCMICCCGHWPIFEGTPIQSLNACCTGEGFDLLENTAGFICGERGRHAVGFLEQYCCERRNPVLQLFYLTILGGTYFAVASTTFQYIPGPYVSAVHRLLGTWGAIIGGILFFLTSYSDPGRITATNVSDYLSMYPYDGVLYKEKTCSTCNLARPPRSKHCSVCGRCVARFDHHCGWTNTCIGENNIRFFITFLFWHCCLTLYGAFVVAAVIASEVKRRNLVRLLTYYYGVEPSFQKLFPHVLQWVMAFYSEQILLLLFLVVISLLLLGFFGYHLYLVLTNTTTNETYKWEAYRRWQSQQSHSNTESTSETSPSSSEQVPKKRLRLVCSIPFLSRNQAAPRKEILKRRNVYDKGFLQNLGEVFFPRSCQLWCNSFRFSKHKKP